MLSSALLAAVALGGAASASAIPTVTAAADPDMIPAVGEPDLALAKRADATNPWVTIDDSKQPVTTYTPSISTGKDGTTTFVNQAPHDLTASVYTWTTLGEIATSTGEPPNPTATGKNNEGSFARCYNKDGPNAPFCHPYVNSTLHTGHTYYVTWDPDYFKDIETPKNASLEITLRLNYLNQTSEEFVLLKDDYDSNPYDWGFYALPVDGSMLKGHRSNNVTIQLLTLLLGSNARNATAEPLHVELADPGFPKNKDTPVPKARELTIALPAAFGAIVVLVIGLCLWNRKTRRIQLGNIMSRKRHGYSGRSERRRLFRSGANKDSAALNGGAIQLDNSPTHGGPDSPTYRDVPDHHRERRGSDDLDSLAGSPIQDSFQEQGTTGGGRNAFRDEMERQNNERRGDFY